MIKSKITTNKDEVKQDLQQVEDMLTLKGLGAEDQTRDYISNMGKMEILTGGARSGQPYKELKPETVFAKGDDRFLIDSGKLLRDVGNLKTQTTDIRQVITLTNEAAVFLQNGTKFMPKRKIFNVVQKDEQNLSKIIEQAANKNIADFDSRTGNK